MKKNTRFFEEYNISSVIIFYGIVLLYTLWIGIEIDVKKIFTILVFTIIFGLANSLQSSKSPKK